ncbi:MAG: LysR family transcriptional regulator [Ilumatobacteraceae bacterium]|nr:LysR family transcriptional regulator [Ilumatobacteraceae bacterium]
MRQLPDISIRQLEYLVAVADSPTWAVAAADVGVSPSALSQGLAELERRVGVDLFRSAGRRRVVREAASPVLDHARQVVSLTGDLQAWSQRVRGAAVGSVRLGMIDVAALVHFRSVLAAFRADRPDVDVHLTVAPSRGLLDSLRIGDLDVVVCVEPAELPVGVSATVVLEEPLVIYAPRGVSIDHPQRWGPWVLFPADSHSRQQIEAALRACSAPIVVAAESHQPDVLRHMVGLGLGWTVLPEVQGPSGRIAVAGPELLTRRIVLARREGAVTDPAADELAVRLLA